MKRISIIIMCMLATYVASCHRRSLINEFQRPDVIKLSESVYLHRTSAKTITITDGDGFGVVNGNVIAMGKMPLDENVVVVEYVPFMDDSLPTPAGDYTKSVFASINLSSATVEPIAAESNVSKSALVNIGNYFKK